MDARRSLRARRRRWWRRRARLLTTPLLAAASRIFANQLHVGLLVRAARSMLAAERARGGRLVDGLRVHSKCSKYTKYGKYSTSMVSMVAGIASIVRGSHRRRIRHIHDELRERPDGDVPLFDTDGPVQPFTGAAQRAYGVHTEPGRVGERASGRVGQRASGAEGRAAGRLKGRKGGTKRGREGGRGGGIAGLREPGGREGKRARGRGARE